MGSRECGRTVRYRQLAIVFLILTFGASLSRAQDNYEIQVYGSLTWSTPDTQWWNSIATSRLDGFKDSRGMAFTPYQDHAEHETVEITHGFNDWFELRFLHLHFHNRAGSELASGWAITSARALPSLRNGTGL